MSNNNLQAREVALKTLQSFEQKPTSLISYQSQGRLIIVADKFNLEQSQNLSDELLPIRICLADSPATDFDFTVKDHKTISIQGYLGNFQIEFIDSAGLLQKLKADMVLDLNNVALIKHEVPAPGYLHANLEQSGLKNVELELLDMIGEFEKPKYFKYNPDICAHSSNGLTVCTNCIDACPTGAISSLLDKVEVDPYLCQGGGSCATVCPSGAMQYVFPSLSDSGNRLRKMLQIYYQSGGANATVLFHSEHHLPELILQQNDSVLPVQVDEIASVGSELCLSAIAYGAQQVVLLDNDEVPMISRQKIKEQQECLQAILSGLNLDTLMVKLLPDINLLETVSTAVPFKASEIAMPDNKRTAFYQALDHLYQQAEHCREMIELPAGAAFGTATIDESRCTLCMACVGACPGKALQDGSNHEVPDIFFIESHCIQCGTCTQTCPEDAISISPRFIFDREKRNKPRVLNQDSPFACISCGKPFAPTSVIHKMTNSLTDHYMFKTSRARNRLKMCADCRVADIVQDPDSMNSSFDPLQANSPGKLS
jgi:ferredoxin